MLRTKAFGLVAGVAAGIGLWLATGPVGAQDPPGNSTTVKVDGVDFDSHHLFGPVIHAYTRAQAIADGVLIDVSRLSSEAGFRFPAAMTAAAWAQTVAWPDDQDTGQSEEGRLWDVVYMAAYAGRGKNVSELIYTLGVVPRGGHEPETVQLKYVVGPGDHGEPVVTIMLPEES